LIKRTFDFLVSATLSIAALPVFIILVIAVLVTLGRPVFFTQSRPGLNGKFFVFYKLRSMSDEHDTEGNLLPDGKRLTAFGLWLRRTSLDELPQLFNVLKGDMSLVGPRPLLVEYLPLYTGEQFRRHEVKPGITGWAQVNGRNDLTWEEKFSLDVWYVDHQSFWLDIKILRMTLVKIFRAEGINKIGHPTMERFCGSDSSRTGQK
jgi:sugar transferase EpsL